MRNQIERPGISPDIEIMQVVHEMWLRRVTLIAITAVVAVIATIYVYLVQPVYEAEALVMPPTQDDIVGLNSGRGTGFGFPLLGAKEIYSVYVRNLRSEYLKRQFFRDVYLPAANFKNGRESRDELYRQFTKELAVSLVDEGEKDHYSISLEGSSPEVAVEWVRRYLAMANRFAMQEILKGIQSEYLVRVNNLQRQIEASREDARKQRADRVAQLTEALVIAKSIGLEKPPIISNNLSSEVSAGMNGSLMYMRGSRALQSEIDNLNNRESDDPYIADLRRMQAEQAFYKNLEISTSNVQIYREDGEVEAPDRPIKPKRALIISLGVLVGFLLGTMFILARLVWRETYKPN